MISLASQTVFYSQVLRCFATSNRRAGLGMTPNDLELVSIMIMPGTFRQAKSNLIDPHLHDK